MRTKLLKPCELEEWRKSIRREHRKLVVTNGCFDILHRGHVEYLAAARALGDILLVGLNSDSSVRALKGPSRPLNSEDDRAAVLAALESVSAVLIFGEKRAEAFLRSVRPDIWVKGGDYTLETLDRGEVNVMRACGGQIKILPAVPGYSTTTTIYNLTKEGLLA